MNRLWADLLIVLHLDEKIDAVYIFAEVFLEKFHESSDSLLQIRILNFLYILVPMIH